MATDYTVELYDGTQHPATTPTTVVRCATLREARREAARMLGHKNLRGAATWDRPQGGAVYQFGPHQEENGYDFAVIIADGDDGYGDPAVAARGR